jgi:hypothetical protein
MELIDATVKYHSLRTFSPTIYAEHLTYQLIGHSLGWFSLNKNSPPRGEIHNSYLCLLGESGITKKTTAQNDTIGELYPGSYRGTASFSPEGLLQEMGGIFTKDKVVPPRPSLMFPMGEFSIVLRSIKNGGNMSNFKEIANDLFTRRNEYKKKLVSNEYWIVQPYLSLSTTCTEEEFFDNLTPDMVHGGFLPRWLLVYSDKPERKNIVLPDNIDDIENTLKEIYGTMFNVFQKKPVGFIFDKSAEKEITDIENELYDDSKYESVQPFVSRYIGYIKKYADILCISEKVSKLTGLTELTNLTTLTTLTNIDSKVNSVYPVNIVNLVNSDHINRSKQLILPCLDYARKVAQYVDEDLDLRKVVRVLDGKKEMDRSYLLQHCHLSSWKLTQVLNTLDARNEYTCKPIDGNDGKKKYIVRKV